MKKIIPGIFIWLLVAPMITFSQSKDETEVLKRVDQLRQAMLDADEKVLTEITSERLSYGHSNGRIEDKKEFIHKLVSGESDFIKMELTDKKLIVSGRTVIFRCRLDGEAIDDGKPGQPKLHVLMVWQKENGNWKLLARQAAKLP